MEGADLWAELADVEVEEIETGEAGDDGGGSMEGDAEEPNARPHGAHGPIGPQGAPRRPMDGEGVAEAQLNLFFLQHA